MRPVSHWPALPQEAPNHCLSFVGLTAEDHETLETLFNPKEDKEQNKQKESCSLGEAICSDQNADNISEMPRTIKEDGVSKKKE